MLCLSFCLFLLYFLLKIYRVFCFPCSTIYNVFMNYYTLHNKRGHTTHQINTTYRLILKSLLLYYYIKMKDLETFKNELIAYNYENKHKGLCFNNIYFKTDKTNCTYLFFEYGVLKFELNDHFTSFITLLNTNGNYTYDQVYNSLGLHLTEDKAIQHIVNNYNTIKTVLEGVK